LSNQSAAVGKKLQINGIGAESIVDQAAIPQRRVGSAE
jgi:hypothetical protein